MITNSARTFPKAPIVGTLLIWGLFALCAPLSVGWRDSGEFIISAFYLDIPHSAGFPLYSHLAHLFTLIPLGPIAWRVHLFSAAVAAVTGLLSALIVFEICRTRFVLSHRSSSLLSLIPFCVLLAVKAFDRQALSAEVYLLNGALILAVTCILLRGLNDRRSACLTAAAFISGLAASNHIASVLVLGPTLLWGMYRLRPGALDIAKIVLWGICGLTPYLAIPLRAAEAPPLNTATASTMQGVQILITAERDRNLRAEAVPVIGAVHASTTSVQIARLPIVRDFPSVLHELGGFMLLASILGCIACLVRAKDLLILLFISSAGTLLFFTGWDPDPWVPVWTSAAILVGIGIGWLLSHGQTLFAGAVTALLVLLPLLGRASEIAAELNALRALGLPADATRALLSSAPKSAVILLEPSWFLAKYMRDIEGVRSDLTHIHAPALLYPEYFSAPILSLPNDRLSLSAQVSDLRNIEDRTKGIGRFIGKVAPHVPVSYEPSELLSQALKGISIYDLGLPTVRWQMSGKFNPDFTNAVIERADAAHSATKTLPPSIRSDAMNYFEAVFNGYANQAWLMGDSQSAAKILGGLCTDRGTLGELPTQCSARSLNNLAVYLMRAGLDGSARAILLDLIAQGGPLTESFKQNLTLIEQKTRK